MSRNQYHTATALWDLAITHRLQIATPMRRTSCNVGLLRCLPSHCSHSQIHKACRSKPPTNTFHRDVPERCSAWISKQPYLAGSHTCGISKLCTHIDGLVVQITPNGAAHPTSCYRLLRQPSQAPMHMSRGRSHLPLQCHCLADHRLGEDLADGTQWPCLRTPYKKHVVSDAGRCWSLHTPCK